MGIRCSAKALIARDGRLLLIRCRRQGESVCYDLSGS